MIKGQNLALMEKGRHTIDMSSSGTIKALYEGMKYLFVKYTMVTFHKPNDG
jgi:hypothetical protein